MDLQIIIMPAIFFLMLAKRRRLVLCTALAHTVSALVLQDYKFLTFARIPPPAPPPWVETHGLLRAAISAFVKKQAARLSDGHNCSLASAAAELDLEWYTSMLARLHINSFRFLSCSLNIAARGIPLSLELELWVWPYIFT